MSFDYYNVKRDTERLNKLREEVDNLKRAIQDSRTEIASSLGAGVQITLDDIIDLDNLQYLNLDGSKAMQNDIDMNEDYYNNVINLNAARFLTSPSITAAEGDLFWDSVYKTLKIKNDTDAAMRLNQDMSVRVHNATGVTLSKGAVVYINGSSTLPTVALASNAALSTSDRVLGMVAADIDDATEGFVITTGIVSGLNTASISAGSLIYLSAAGAYTATLPTSPSFIVKIGHVVVSDTTEGIVFVTNPQLIYPESFRINNNSNISPAVPGVGQLVIQGSGYKGYHALDATGLHIGVDSSIRDIIFRIGSTDYVKIKQNGRLEAYGNIRKYDSYSHSSISSAIELFANFPIQIYSDYAPGNQYFPLLGFATEDNNNTRTKAAIFAIATGSGSSIYFAASSGYGTGANKYFYFDWNGHLINPNRGIGLNTTAITATAIGMNTTTPTRIEARSESTSTDVMLALLRSDTARGIKLWLDASLGEAFLDVVGVYPLTIRESDGSNPLLKVSSTGNIFYHDLEVNGVDVASLDTTKAELNEDLVRVSDSTFSSKVTTCSIPTSAGAGTPVSVEAIAALSYRRSLLESNVSFTIASSGADFQIFTIALEVNIGGGWVEVDNITGQTVGSTPTLTHTVSGGSDISAVATNIQYRILVTVTSGTGTAGTCTATQSGSDSYSVWSVIRTKEDISNEY